jgi:hypothetical protein
MRAAASVREKGSPAARDQPDFQIFPGNRRSKGDARVAASIHPQPRACDLVPVKKLLPNSDISFGTVTAWTFLFGTNAAYCGSPSA